MGNMNHSETPMEKYDEQRALSEQHVRPLYIEGYTDQLSCEPGDEIGFHISTSASQYALEIARLGSEREVSAWTKLNLYCSPQCFGHESVPSGVFVVW